MDIDLSHLSQNEKLELMSELIKKKEFLKSARISVFKPISESQELVIKAVSNAVTKKSKTKIIWASWWNGSGKSGIWAFCTASLAMWENTTAYEARFLWVRKRIAIFVESFESVRRIEEYMFNEPTFDDGSGHVWLCRIPPELIEDIEYNPRPRCVRKVTLKDWTSIEFKTFWQGQKGNSGGNYDFVWIDEPPGNVSTFKEIIARASRINCIILFTATIIDEDYIEEYFDTMPKETKDKTEIFTLLSADNPHADKDILASLGEERLTGRKPERKWKVYDQFHTSRNVVDYFEPTIENMWWYVRHYIGIDPWGNNPFAIVLFCIDEDNNIYVYKEFSLEGDTKMTFSNAFRCISPWMKRYKYEKIVIDMRDKLMINEWKNELWLTNLEQCDKSTKWPRWETNIVWRRMRVNEFFAEWKIIIANSCPVIIRQFTRMKYKNNVSEKDTAKSDVFWKDDDCVDAFWYAFDKATKNIRLHDIRRLKEYRENEKTTDISKLFPKQENTWNSLQQKSRMQKVQFTI